MISSAIKFHRYPCYMHSIVRRDHPTHTIIICIRFVLLNTIKVLLHVNCNYELQRFISDIVSLGHTLMLISLETQERVVLDCA